MGILFCPSADKSLLGPNQLITYYYDIDLIEFGVPVAPNPNARQHSFPSKSSTSQGPVR